MRYFKQLTLPTYDNLLEELNRVVKWDDYGQICLNSPPGFEDDHQYGQGSLIKDWSNSYEIWDDELKTNRWVVPDRETPLHEHDFTETVNVFRGTVFEDILAMLRSHYAIGRVRVMKLRPKSCLTWHRDDTRRLHYPILTNPGSMMVIEDQVQHFEVGEWWLADTLHLHTAINAWTEPRLHLVICIL